ncbi:MAG: anaerobic ribonucleoside triphosphate reductase [Oscillospiraceae bacterium]|nr:anaerobic ribonucleoside triphosphate reductase [Oscillospiraceae bacterium]
MLTSIIKRDGRVVIYDRNKIKMAILKAMEASGNTDFDKADEVTESVERYFNNQNSKSTPSVEEIQDQVEHELMAAGLDNVAKKYILYRASRNTIRERKTKLVQVFDEITFSDALDSDVKRENANIDGDTPMGTMLKYGSESAKDYFLKFLLSPDQAEAHRDGYIHIHDFDFYALTMTCCQIDLIKLFKGGFSTGHGFLREPNDIQSYSALACIAIQSNQNDQHGGQSIVNFDYGLADGVRKTYRKLYLKNIAKVLDVYGEDVSYDQLKEISAAITEKCGAMPKITPDETYVALELEELKKLVKDPANAEKAQHFALTRTEDETDKATYQAMEAFIHNLNTMHSRAGAQTPFSSINYGMDTSDEGRMVMKNVLLATDAGLGHGETPIFPIQIFRVKEGINYNPGERNYDLFQLAIKVSAKRLFPNFSFQDAPYNLKYYNPNDVRTEIGYMGCRTRVVANTYDPDNEITYGRGNLSFTSINLPRLAIEAKGDEDLFYRNLKKYLDLCVKQLMDRFAIQKKKRVRNFPFLMGQGVWIDSDKLGIDDEVGEVIKHGTLSVGFIGLAETLTALYGKHHGESEEAQKKGLEIIGFMRRILDEYSERYKLNFSLLATPAEGLSGRFVRIDKKRFGEIKGVTDKEYYTNSFHVPVAYEISAFDKIRLEAPYHALTNAGHITYVELDGDVSQNLEAFEAVVRAMKEYGIGYGAINHPVDRDPVCGYNGIIGDVCPRCGRRDGEGVPLEKLQKLGLYKHLNASTLGQCGNPDEEADRIPNTLV